MTFSHRRRLLGEEELLVFFHWLQDATLLTFHLGNMDLVATVPEAVWPSAPSVDRQGSCPVGADTPVEGDRR